MTEQTWLDQEPGFSAGLRQAARLTRDGLRRPWLGLLVVTLLSALVAGGALLHEPVFAPRFVLRVVEDSRDPGSMPRPKAELAGYVRQGIFTSAPLFALIHRHGLYAKLMSVNPRAALDSFREDISVDVYRNYFVEARVQGGLPRSARVTVSYHAKDRDIALAVTRELGALIATHEQAARREQASSAARAAALTRDSVQRALELGSQEVLDKQREIRLAATPDPALQVELVSLLGSLAVLEHRAEAADKHATALDLGAAFERRGLGLRFELVDDASLPSGQDQLKNELWLLGGGFVLGLPLLTMAIGAFGTRQGKA